MKQQKEAASFINRSLKMQTRSPEYDYLKEIFSQYCKGQTTQLIQRMFQTLHSDWLNLDISSSNQSVTQKNIKNFQFITSKTQYKPGDIILEIRGSIINKNKLQNLLKNKPQICTQISKVNCLLFGEQRNQVLVPKGLSQKLLKSDKQYMNFVQKNQEKANCLIEWQFGSKYLVSAQKQIEKGDPLILNLNSLYRHLYQPNEYQIQFQSKQ